MAKKVLTNTGILALTLCAVAIFLFVGHQIRNTKRACQTFTTFVDHLRVGNWASARAMTLTRPEWFRIEDGAIFYWNHDITSSIINSEPSFDKTLEYYLTDRGTGDKVVFGSGYVQLEDGKIKFIKIP